MACNSERAAQSVLNMAASSMRVISLIQGLARSDERALRCMNYNGITNIPAGRDHGQLPVNPFSL